jgi:hypothetical protein
MFASLKHLNPETRRELAIKRLQELRVEVYPKENYVQIMIPHKLQSVGLIEIGILMAQLTDIPFPEQYAPLEDAVPSAVLPHRSKPAIKFVESYPHGMKFRIYRKS